MKNYEKFKMTEDEVRALPVGVPLVTAGRVLHMGTTKTRELARRGEFPCRVIKVGNAYIVPKAELLRLLGIDQDPSPQETAELAS